MSKMAACLKKPQMHLRSRRLQFLAALCACLVPLAGGQTEAATPTPTPSSSATVTPWASASMCDAAGNCFVGLTGSFTWYAASTACVDLGVGWALATITDAATGASAVGVGPGAHYDCMGRVPGGTSYWIGLYDPHCCAVRTGGRTNKTYGGWQWSSGLPADFFLSAQAAWWASAQPDNAGGAQGCADWWSNGQTKLDDLSCGAKLPAACCMLPPPSPSPTVSLSATPSLTVGVSPSATANISGTPTATASSTPSIYVETVAAVAVDGGAITGYIIAAILVGALVLFTALVLVPAYALWRRQRAKRRGGAMKSPSRVRNSQRRDTSVRLVIDEAGDVATRNPVQALAGLQLAPVRVASAPRFADVPSAAKRPSAKAMGLGV